MKTIEAARNDTEKRKEVTVEEIEVEGILASQPAGRSYADKTKQTGTRIEEEGGKEFKSNWARQISQQSLEKQLKMANEAASRMEEQEGENVFKERGRKRDKKVLKLGDSLHDQEDWPWNGSEEEWDGVEDRGEKNKEKKKRERARRKEKVEKAALIGRCIGPAGNQESNPAEITRVLQ